MTTKAAKVIWDSAGEGELVDLEYDWWIVVVFAVSTDHVNGIITIDPVPRTIIIEADHWFDARAVASRCGMKDPEPVRVGKIEALMRMERLPRDTIMNLVRGKKTQKT